jgi:hypothetical protein
MHIVSNCEGRLADGLDAFVFFRHDETGRGAELALEFAALDPGGALVCQDKPPGTKCVQEFEKCTVAGDCCDPKPPTMGLRKDRPSVPADNDDQGES